MSSAIPGSAVTLVLLTEGAGDVPLELVSKHVGTVIVAGPSRLRLALAPLTLPGAETIWTDFRCSASVRSLRSVVEAKGGIDRLVLVGGRSDSDQSFAPLSTILTLLPVLQSQAGADMVLSVPAGAAERSLRAFLDRLAPRLRQDRVRVQWHCAEMV